MEVRPAVNWQALALNGLKPIILYLSKSIFFKTEKNVFIIIRHMYVKPFSFLIMLVVHVSSYPNCLLIRRHISLDGVKPFSFLIMLVVQVSSYSNCILIRRHMSLDGVSRFKKCILTIQSLQF